MCCCSGRGGGTVPLCFVVPFWSKQKSEHSTAAAPGFPVTKWKALRPEIQAFFESEEGQREFAEWKAQQKKDKAKQR